MSDEWYIYIFLIGVIILYNIRKSEQKVNRPINKKKKTWMELENERKRQALEDEMDAYNLEEHEKELVRKGEYNAWDFDTEGPFEDDDYYKDDV